MGCLVPVKKKGGWEYAIVDDDDAERVLAYKWYLLRGGYAGRVLTIWLSEEKRKTSITTLLHRDIMGASKDDEIDHINRNKLDCQKGNLRRVNHGQNGVNRTSLVETASGFRGVFKNSVSKDGRIRWKGMYRTTHLGGGYGDDVRVALAVKYDEHALADIGPSADLNFPREN